MGVNNILVPINYSGCSINALRHAGNLAKQFKCQILILHALNNDNIATAEEIENQKAEHVKKINDLITSEPSLSMIMSEALVSEESPKDAILWATNTFNIDLIVIGTEGIHKPYIDLVGSFTYHVISESNLPVLTIPEDCAYVKPHKIGFGVDFKIMDPSAVLEMVKQFTRGFNSKLEIFHIKAFGEETKPKEVKQSEILNNFFNDINHNFITLEQGSVQEGLKAYAEKYDPNILAIMPRKYKFFEWLKHESVTEDAVQHLQLPILTIPESLK